jgi:hypothetical protein
VTDIPGRQQLTGYRLRDYDHLIARLGEGSDGDAVAEAVAVAEDYADSAETEDS